MSSRIWLVCVPEAVPWWVEALLGYGIEDYPTGHGGCYANTLQGYAKPIF